MMDKEKDKKNTGEVIANNATPTPEEQMMRRQSAPRPTAESEAMRLQQMQQQMQQMQQRRQSGKIRVIFSSD